MVHCNLAYAHIIIIMQIWHTVEPVPHSESDRVNKIRASSVVPSQLIASPGRKPSTTIIAASSNAFHANGKLHSHSKHHAAPCNGHHSCQLNESSSSSSSSTSSSSSSGAQQKQSIQKHHPIEIHREKNMEFLIPRAPNAAPTTCQSQATLSSIVAPAFTLNDIKNHLSDNFKIIQSSAVSQQKMTKKQLKLAQAQLEKLTIINIHLQGR